MAAFKLKACLLIRHEGSLAVFQGHLAAIRQGGEEAGILLHSGKFSKRLNLYKTDLARLLLTTS